MTQSVKPSFGWDLAGYGKSGSALCRADRSDNTITAKVFRAPFICCPKLKIGSSINDTVLTELEMLRRFAKIGNTYVDVPVDLQTLARTVDFVKDEPSQYYWQLVKRPVDHVFKALEPLGSNLGFAVARISHLLGRLAAEGAGLTLDENFFETYPAATLQLVWHTNKWTEAKYKGGKVVYKDGKWQGQSRKANDKKALKNEGLATLANCLNLRAAEEDKMTDDEFDAVICAINGSVFDCTITRESLSATIRKRLVASHGQQDWISSAEPPRGYIVFDRLPDGIQIELKWIECHTPDDLFRALE